METAGTWIPPLPTLALAAVLAVAVLAAGAAKLARLPAMRHNAAHLGFSVSAYQRIGALEVAGGVGVLLGLALPLLGAVAAGCLALLLVLAAATHLRRGDGPLRAAPAAVLAVVAVALTALLAREV